MFNLPAYESALGCQLEKVKTDSPDWVRVFIIYEGVTIGRLSLLKGELYTSKFYKDKLTGPNVEVCMHDQIAARYIYFTAYGVRLKDSIFKEMVRQAALWSGRDLEARLFYRSTLKKKKRSKLQAPDIRRAVQQLARGRALYMFNCLTALPELYIEPDYFAPKGVVK